MDLDVKKLAKVGALLRIDELQQELEALRTFLRQPEERQPQRQDDVRAHHSDAPGAPATSNDSSRRRQWTPEARARMSKATKARWRKAKRAGKQGL